MSGGTVIPLAVRAVIFCSRFMLCVVCRPDAVRARASCTEDTEGQIFVFPFSLDKFCSLWDSEAKPAPCGVRKIFGGEREGRGKQNRPAVPKRGFAGRWLISPLEVRDALGVSLLAEPYPRRGQQDFITKNFSDKPQARKFQKKATVHSAPPVHPDRCPALPPFFDTSTRFQACFMRVNCSQVERWTVF
jgi:hypothetical protein